MSYWIFFEPHLRNLKLQGNQLNAHCPFHEDRRASFSANAETGLWKCHAGCGQGNARQFAERLGIEPPTENDQGTKRQVITGYVYKDEHSHPLFRVCRTTPKGFFQERYDGGQWVNGLKEVRRVLYRLPEILKAPVVYIVEGEKDVDRLWGLGIPATCNPGGAGKWREEYSESLRGKKAVVIPDNDDPGEDHALQVVKFLLPFAEAVKIVHLPGLGPRLKKHGEDLSDWLDKGHTREELAEAVTRTRLVDPENSFPHYREEPVRNESLVLQTWADFVATEPEQGGGTIEGMAPDAGLLGIIGRGKGGKTTLAMHMGRSIAEGKPFLRQATQQKPVVYVNYEMPPSYLHYLVKMGGCPDGTYLISRPEPVLSITTVETIIKQVGSPCVIIIDSFRGAFRLRGDGENSAGEAGVVLRNLQDLAVKTDSLIAIVHHANRGQREGTDAVSGTSDWLAAPDVIWAWSRPKPEDPGTLYIEGRVPPMEPLGVKLSLSECTLIGTMQDAKKQMEVETILAALDGLEGQSSDEIAMALDMAPATVRKRLESVEGMLTTKTGKGVKGDPQKWSKIHSAQDNPLGAETNNDLIKEDGQCQTLEL